MRILVSDRPSGRLSDAWRCCVGTGRFELALRRAWCELGRPASPRPRQLDALREAAEPLRRHRRLSIVDDRVDLDLSLDRYEVTLVELAPVVDETPPWWDEERLP